MGIRPIQGFEDTRVRGPGTVGDRREPRAELVEERAGRKRRIRMAREDQEHVAGAEDASRPDRPPVADPRPTIAPRPVSPSSPHARRNVAPAQKPGAVLDRIVATEPASTRPARAAIVRPGHHVRGGVPVGRGTVASLAERSAGAAKKRRARMPPSDGRQERDEAFADLLVPRVQAIGGVQARAVEDGDAEPRPEHLEHRRRRQLDRINARPRLPTQPR